MMKTTPMIMNDAKQYNYEFNCSETFHNTDFLLHWRAHAMFNIMVLYDNLSGVSIAKFLIEEEDNRKFQHV